MSEHEALATALTKADAPREPDDRFADTLLLRLLDELAGDTPTARRTTRRARVILVAAALALVLTGVAAATYLALRSPAAASRPARHNGPVTVDAAGAIVAIGADGRLHPIWRCPAEHGCGILNGVAWSDDGRWLAYVTPQWGRHNPAAGIHVVDTRTRHESTIPPEDLGCNIPADIDWSPDGRRLAYACPSRIFLIGRSLRDPTPLATPRGALSSPSWSPDESHLAFALHVGPLGRGRSSVYIAGTSGTAAEPRLLARRATAPAWSPDGRVIAVRTSCGGIKLFTPSGRDVTPAHGPFACRAIGVPGIPIWSPDGKKLAVQMRPHGGIFLLDRDGTHLTRLTPRASAADTGGGAFGGSRPAWRPVRHASGVARAPGGPTDL